MTPRRRPVRRRGDEAAGTSSIAVVTVAGWSAVMVAPSFDVSARQALDRTKTPAPGKTPDLRVPTWTKTALANGADLIVSEKHDLPLVSFSLTFLGGASQFEPAERTGLASLTAAMMSEGTKTRDGEALSNALQLLGTSVSTSVGSESGSIELRLDDRQVRSDDRHPGRHAAQLHVSGRGARTSARAAPGGADAGPGAAWSDRRPGVSQGALRRVTSVRPRRHGRLDQGHHARRHRRLPLAVFSARTSAHHRRRRRDGGGREAGGRKGAWRRGRRRGRVRPSRIPRCPSRKKRRSISSIGLGRRSRRWPSASPGHHEALPTTTRCR